MSLRRCVWLILVFSALYGCAAHSPAPVSGLNKDYGSVTRGSYRGSYYEVEKGDTLYFIAYVTDKDVNDIIRYNGLTEPYTIYPGQKLNLWRSAYKAPAFGGTGAGAVSAPVAVVAATPSTPDPSKNSNQSVTSQNNSSQKNVTQTPPKKSIDQSKSKEYVEPKKQQSVNKNANTATSSKASNTASNQKVSKWLWPTKGRVIKNFSAGDQGNKGIDIAGQRGQSIVSTASGTVVYSGNALRGYGNLVIIKHNDNYLSAYAHNDKLLVHEGQSVKAGQKIATMGSSGTNSVRLHFEIRYQGKSVDPKRYLP
ncbi:murein hydrolase activator NlpD [Vibrio scophthalmi]|uniref:murein hydrolase activator NlpD n=1 Tax=Vibrio scophthalmi TaxID=45658 RepID=UPI002FF09CC0